MTREINIIQKIIESDNSIPNVKLIELDPDQLVVVAGECKEFRPDVTQMILCFVRVTQGFANAPKYHRLEVLRGGLDNPPPKLENKNKSKK